MPQPLNPVLTIVNNALNGQGRPNGPDELWFFNAAIAYKLTTYVGYQVDSYNRFTDRWLTLIWRGTADQVIRDLPLYGPFLSADQIDVIWGDVFSHQHTNKLDPLLIILSMQMSGGIPKGNTELWYYNPEVAFKATNCSQKYCVNRVSRIADDMFGEWIPQVESGDLADALKAIGEGVPFLPLDQVNTMWGQLSRHVLF